MRYSRKQLEALGEPLGSSITQKKLGGGYFAGDGGGSSAPSAPTQQTVTQTNIPEWAQPYATRVFGQAEALTQAPYQQYQGQRIANFSPMQQQAFMGLAGMQPSGQLAEASDIASGVAQQAGQYGQYQPQQFGNQYGQGPSFQSMGLGYLNAYAPALERIQMEAPQDVYGSQAQAAQMAPAPMTGAAQFQAPQTVSAERVQAPGVRDLSMQAAPNISAADLGGGVQTRDIQAAQTGYNPNLQAFQMGPAERVSTDTFTQPGTAASYMSPYMQNVVDIQQREAQRQADIAKTQRGAQAVAAGAFGGSRQAIMESEAARNLALQKGDIQAQGLQAAYNQAQQAFQVDQARQLQAAQANQAAGLTAGQQNLQAQLATQQLGTQTGLQTALANMSNQQQAAVQNEANRLQASGMNSQQALQVAMANQQNQQQANLQNLSAGLQTQGLQAQTGLQAQQLNQATGLQAALANQQTGYNAALQNAQLAQQAALANQGLAGQYGLQQGQFGQAAAMQNAQLAQQAALANQQARLTTGQQNLAALLGIQQLGAGQNLQAQLANQGAFGQMQGLAAQQNLAANQQAMQNAQLRAQYGLAGQQAGEQSRQFGANLGLQGLAQQLGAAGALGNLGQQQYQQGLGINTAQQQAGAQQQALNQQIMAQNYQDFLTQQQYPYTQLGYMSNILRGMPVGGSTQQVYQAPGSTLGMGVGLAGGIGSLLSGLYGTRGVGG